MSSRCNSQELYFLQLARVVQQGDEIAQVGGEAGELEFEDSKAAKPSLPIPPEIAECEELQILETVKLKGPVSVDRRTISNN